MTNTIFSIYNGFTRAFCLTILVMLGLTITSPAHALTETIQYDILRNGSPIGQYTFYSETKQGRSLIQAAMDINVKIGPLSVYRASHKRTETWRNGKLLNLAANSVYNGKTYEIKAQAIQNGYSVEVNGKTQTLDGKLSTLSPYLSDAAHDVYVLSEKGKLEKVTREFRGEDAGLETPLYHFNLSGEKAYDLWYDDTGLLSRLSYTKDGAVITFRHVPSVNRTNAAYR